MWWGWDGAEDEEHHTHTPPFTHPATSRPGKHYDFRHTVLFNRDSGKRVHPATGHHIKCHTVDLGFADIGDDGAEAVAEFLVGDTTCTRLDLHKNHNMGDRGARSIGRMMEHNEHIKQLYMWGNNVGDDGVMGLAAGLRMNNVLEELYLNDNHEKLGDRACQYLSKFRSLPPYFPVLT